ncbi:acyl-CoA dehydrogenase family protein [Xylophilus sp.]|uniref:acyl-CoA dehydrogenase family protein n=1 Tax=Xylophilus sp. TaxID=2653893 RepID=UPI002D806FFA|nr:acyl-CoA dehydrogenase family protein [Xylophilus sp.]
MRAGTAEGAAASVVVPVGREGLVLEDDWDGIGQRVTGSGTTRLHQVRVAADEVEFDTAGTAYGLPYSSTLAQLIVTSVVAGILGGIEQEAVALVQRRGERSFNHAAAAKPADDPLLQQTIGQISAAAFAAQTVALAAADALDADDDARQPGAFDAGLALQGLIATAQAKVVIDELVVRAGSQLFDVGGASAATRRYNLDRRWRNARTLVSDNPTAYKARALGQYAVHDTPLPASRFF